MTEERDALEGLLHHAGWTLFWAHVDQEWGAGGARFERTLMGLAERDEDDAVVVQQMRQIAVARREILRLKDWPSTRLRQLAEPAASDGDDRRPPLAPALAGHSRRGGA